MRLGGGGGRIQQSQLPLPLGIASSHAARENLLKYITFTFPLKNFHGFLLAYRKKPTSLGTVFRNAANLSSQTSPQSRELGSSCLWVSVYVARFV